VVPAFDELLKRKGKISAEELDGLFSGLEPVEINEMMGKWQGGFFPTGNKMEIWLKDFSVLKWFGKYFLSPNNVKALVYSILGFKINLPLGTAVLRRMEFRGKLSTSMFYNYLPIIDNFRKVDSNTLMGIMEVKGRSTIYFYLIK
jgi:hypothetical protein